MTTSCNPSSSASLRLRVTKEIEGLAIMKRGEGSVEAAFSL
jgi:hypothetical protein